MTTMMVNTMMFFLWLTRVIDFIAGLAYIYYCFNDNAFYPQALSGVGEAIQDRADILGNTALSAALNTQFLFQIGVFTAVPMILGFILEQGFLTVSFPLMRSFSHGEVFS